MIAQKNWQTVYVKCSFQCCFVTVDSCNAIITVCVETTVLFLALFLSFFSVSLLPGTTIIHVPLHLISLNFARTSIFTVSRMLSNFKVVGQRLKSHNPNFGFLLLRDRTKSFNTITYET